MAVSDVVRNKEKTTFAAVLFVVQSYTYRVSSHSDRATLQQREQTLETHEN
jgi:hypothetical protein